MLSQYIEHTLLKPEATTNDISKVCQEAIKHQFVGVCVNSSYVEFAKSQISSSVNSVKLVCVVGFPLGVCTSESKAFETSLAIRQGADEIDMVIQIGALKEKRYEFVQKDIESVVAAASGKPVKVILETALLTNEEKIKACELSLKAKAHFVKTCTGFMGGGATVEDIQLMKQVVGHQMGIKASGGIKTSEQAKALIEAGANRLGTSSGVSLVSGIATSGGY